MKHLPLIVILLATPPAANAHNLIVPRSVQIKCLPAKLLNIVDRTVHHFHHGFARAVSGYRSPAHNRAVHGAHHSLHMRCMALDFEIKGVSPYKLASYAKSIGAGGVGTYGGRSFIHIDTGPKRQWNWSHKHRKHHAI